MLIPILSLVIVILLLGLALLLRQSGLLGPGTSAVSSSKQESYRYESKQKLLTPAEIAFYRVLVQVLGDQRLIFCKVRVADVVEPSSGLSKSQWQGAFNRISAKHFDFVLCDPQTLTITALIELDDRSHHQPRRRKRDDCLNQATQSAGLPLHRVSIQSAYNLVDLKIQLLGRSEESS